MFECFQNIGANGSSPSSRSNGGGKAKSKSIVIKEFSSELIKISTRTMESNFSHDQLNRLFDTMFPSGSSAISFPDLLESLNHYGQILKKPGNVYKLCVT